MSKNKPPRPANDHVAAMTNPGVPSPDHEMTDEELDTRLAAARAAQRRALKLALLRMSEATTAEWNEDLSRDGRD
jgi:molybdopterin-biosynthesis enzyme MoeA-like protein